MFRITTPLDSYVPFNFRLRLCSFNFLASGLAIPLSTQTKAAFRLQYHHQIWKSRDKEILQRNAADSDKEKQEIEIT